MTGKRIIAGLFLAAICLGGFCADRTMAYMSDKEQVKNHLDFVGKDGLNAILTEPDWQEENGLKVIPNTVIPKNPQVTNTSEIDLDELVALKCEFVYTADCPDRSKAGRILSSQDMASVVEVFQIDYNSDNPEQGDWVRFEGQEETDAVQCFYYRKTLNRNYPETGETTAPLFTELKIPKTVNNGRFSKIQAIGGFDIRISGHVLQQMTGEDYFGLNCAEDAYRAGLFDL